MKKLIWILFFIGTNAQAYSVRGAGVEYDFEVNKKNFQFQSATFQVMQNLNPCSEKNLRPIVSGLAAMLKKSYPKNLMVLTMTEKKRSASIPLDSDDGLRLMNMEMKIRQVKKVCY